MERFYEKLNIPKACLLDNTIFKKAFLDNADLLSSDKKILNDVIKKIVWKYCLKPETINILPYVAEDREYLEIEVIEVQVTDISKSKRIAEIIMRAIPYPIFLVLCKGVQIQLVTGDMRKNLSDSSKVTVDEFVFTEWFDLNNVDEITQKLLSDLNVSNLNFTDYFQMYQDLTGKLNFYNISRQKGEVVSEKETNMSASDIKKNYDEIKFIGSKIEALQNQVKKNTPINEKVEISVQLKQLKRQKEELMKNI